MSDYIFDLDDGTDPDNSAKRLPVALCLDTSGSMSNDIGDLNQAVKLFYQQCKNDAKAKNAVEVVTVEFGYNGVQVASKFSEVEHAQIPHFAAGNGTPMGAAVSLALEQLEQRKAWYKSEGISYYQPILILMSDGHAGDSIIESSHRAKDMVENKKLLVLPLAFGSADTRTLESFSGGLNALHINQGFSFLEFFQWLSASTSTIASGKDFDVNKELENIFTSNGNSDPTYTIEN